MVYFITGNQKKLDEARAILGDIQALPIDLPEIQELDPHKIIAAKLASARKHTQEPCIVEDTSLYCEGLNNLPGPLIKWFLEALGNAGLATLVQKTGNTKARATTIIGYAHGTTISYFEGTIQGNIVAPQGPTNFGWDPIFMPEGKKHTFAEMTKEEKNTLSMRRLAFEQLKVVLSPRR